MSGSAIMALDGANSGIDLVKTEVSAKTKKKENEEKKKENENCKI